MDLVPKLEAMLARGNDTATLRFALASAYLGNGDPEQACRHAEVAVTLDPDYSAAWKVLGKAHSQAGRPAEAAASYERGIAVAERRGDAQAAKEMRVFLKRLQPPGSEPSDADGNG